MSMANVFLLVLAALGDVYALFLKDRADSSATPAAVYSGDSNALDSRVIRRFNHTPVIDSLPPVAHSNASAPSNNRQLTTTAVTVILAFVTLCTVVTIIIFLVRYFMRRAAVKRRRQASWILQSGQWNKEPMRTDAHETRTGCSDTSSSFAAYPYPLSEHF